MGNSKTFILYKTIIKALYHIVYLRGINGAVNETIPRQKYRTQANIPSLSSAADTVMGGDPSKEMCARTQLCSHTQRIESKDGNGTGNGSGILTAVGVTQIEI
jgi:hypothetical protein